jgi:hypothetical protein
MASPRHCQPSIQSLTLTPIARDEFREPVRHTAPGHMGNLAPMARVYYRLLNWKPRRARFRPYFLRSFTRGSRVR